MRSFSTTMFNFSKNFVFKNILNLLEFILEIRKNCTNFKTFISYDIDLFLLINWYINELTVIFVILNAREKNIFLNDINNVKW